MLAPSSTSTSPLSDEGYSSGDETTLSLTYEKLFADQNRIKILSQHYQRFLQTINSEKFAYLPDDVRFAYCDRLKQARDIFNQHYRLNEIEQRLQNQALLRHYINTTNNYLCAIGEKPAPPLTYGSDSPVKYLGMNGLATFLIAKVREFSRGKVDVIKEWIQDINEKRLYWIWGGGLLTTILQFLPSDFAYEPQAAKLINAPSLFTGYLSWLIFYGRLLFECSLVLIHTLPGPWMSEDEKSLYHSQGMFKGTWARFKNQIHQRKFLILNDLLWGTLNLVSFFWLTGTGVAGTVGNVLVSVFLLIDAGLGLWRLYEEYTAYQTIREEYDNQIADLKMSCDFNIGLIARSKQDKIQYFEFLDKRSQRSREQILKDSEESFRNMIVKGDFLPPLPFVDEHELVAETNKKIELRRQLIQLKFDYAVDWIHKRNAHFINIATSLSMAIAFPLACSLFTTFTLPVTMSLTLVGAYLCFTFMIVGNMAGGANDLYKTHLLTESSKENVAVIMTALANPRLSENEKKLLQFDLEAEMAQTQYHKDMARYQKISLIRSLAIDMFLPILIFSTTVFLPLGFALGGIAAGFALIVVSKRITEQFKPQEIDLMPQIPASEDPDNDLLQMTGK